MLKDTIDVYAVVFESLIHPWTTGQICLHGVFKTANCSMAEKIITHWQIMQSMIAL
jgi:hypothetical protein